MPIDKKNTLKAGCFTFSPFRSDYHMQSVIIPLDISDNQFKTSEICTTGPNFICKCLNPLRTFPIVILKTSEIRKESLINTMRYKKNHPDFSDFDLEKVY